jgi:hypothetical protein
MGYTAAATDALLGVCRPSVIRSLALANELNQPRHEPCAAGELPPQRDMLAPLTG